MNEHKNLITIEDEIKEFSDKPVKSSALFKALEEKGVPDSSEASVGDVLTKGEDGIGWAAPGGGGSTGGLLVEFGTEIKGSGYSMYVESTTLETDVIQAIASGKSIVFHFPEIEETALIEAYVNLMAYYPTPISGYHKYSLNGDASLGGSSWNYVDAIDGKMVAYIYVD